MLKAAVGWGGFGAVLVEVVVRWQGIADKLQVEQFFLSPPSVHPVPIPDWPITASHPMVAEASLQSASRGGCPAGHQLHHFPGAGHTFWQNATGPGSGQPWAHLVPTTQGWTHEARWVGQTTCLQWGQMGLLEYAYLTIIMICVASNLYDSAISTDILHRTFGIATLLSVKTSMSSL